MMMLIFTQYFRETSGYFNTDDDDNGGRP